MCLLVACSNPESWSCYGGEGSRCLCSRNPGPTQPRLLWIADVEGTKPGAPVVDSGGIYIPHSGGSVTKVNLKGKVLWRFDSWVGEGNLPPHLLLLPGDQVLVCTQGLREEAFLLNGAGEIVLGPPWLPWAAAMGPAANSDGYAVVCHQYVFEANAIALRIYGIRAGESLWRWDWAAAGQSYYGSNPVVLEDGRAYVFIEVAGGNNFLVALDSTGHCCWQREFPGMETQGVGKAIAAGSDLVFFGTTRIEDISKVYSPGRLHAIDSQGEIQWQVEAGQRVEQIFVSPGLVVANLLRSKLLAVNMEGQEQWQYLLEGWESNGVMDSRGRVYLAGVQNGSVWLRAVDAKGRGMWEFDTKERAESVSYLALANGIIYLATDCCKLLAISD